MRNAIQKRSTEIVKGSLAEIARASGKTVAEAFVEAECVVIVDVSGSMGSPDSRGGRKRYDVACEELGNLQGRFPGKIAVIGFSTDTKFYPAGVPDMIGGSTNLAGALEYSKIADVEGMRFFVISDGEPDEANQALAMAKSYKCKIDTIFVGAEGAHGSTFLAQLAKESGGAALTAACVDGMGEKMVKLLTANGVY